MLIFASLGPKGSNHDWVAQRYLQFHRLEKNSRLVLFANFDEAFESMLRGDAHHVIQVAVHSSVTSSVARYRGRAHIIDTFISPSQAMAVLTRTEVDVATSLGLQAATRDYVDVSRWQSLVTEPSTVAVAQGLLDGKYDSGLTLLRFAAQHPGRFRVEEVIGEVVDPWLVYGTRPTCKTELLAWPDSPAASLYREREA
jgi:hypothetical protein